MIEERHLDVFDVRWLDGTPRCWMCADGEPRIDNRWCSVRCKRAGEEMIAHDPSPNEISVATTRIRATWSVDEQDRRVNGFRLAELLDLQP
jgi:hypothetical protein